MLDTLITSQTRINLLIKFFMNPGTRSYLRELASELESLLIVLGGIKSLSKKKL